MNQVALLSNAPADLPGPRVPDTEQAVQQGYALVLGFYQGRLSLWNPAGKETPLAAGFDSGTLGYRLERVQHEMLVRAMGGAGDADKPVVDATAGLGRDAALLAMAGYPVTMLERQPLIHAMLEDALGRLGHQNAPLLQQLRLLQAESAAYLASHPNSCHGVYLDPMFPERNKSAAVKKNLRWLQTLAEQPLDQSEEEILLNAALTAATKKVVVKRPLRAPCLAGRKPGHALTGKAVRFDVYVARAN